MDHPALEAAGNAARDAGRRERRGPLRLLSDYLTLTKPPIISLLLITAIGGMFLASRHQGGSGIPDLLTLLLVCVGGGPRSRRRQRH